MSDLDAIRSCLDVTEEHFRRALAPAQSLSEASPRERCIALLNRMAAVALPNAAGPRLLMLLAQMAKRDWIDGDLVVRMIGDHELAVLELLVDDGTSSERILGPLRIDVPLGEFIDYFKQNATRLLPLKPMELTARGLLLRGVPELRTQGRKASISAFAAPQVSQPREAPAEQRRPPPLSRPQPPPPSRPQQAPPPLSRPRPPPPRQRPPAGGEELASFDKAPALIELPDALKRK